MCFIHRTDRFPVRLGEKPPRCRWRLPIKTVFWITTGSANCCEIARVRSAPEEARRACGEPAQERWGLRPELLCVCGVVREHDLARSTGLACDTGMACSDPERLGRGKNKPQKRYVPLFPPKRDQDSERLAMAGLSPAFSRGRRLAF